MQTQSPRRASQLPQLNRPTLYCAACGALAHHARGLCSRCYGAARAYMAAGLPWTTCVRRVRKRFAPPLAADGLPQDFPLGRPPQPHTPHTPAHDGPVTVRHTVSGIDLPVSRV